MIQRMLPAEIARAEVVLRAALECVRQDRRVYGAGHVSKINVSRVAAAYRYVGYLNELIER